MKYSCFLEKVRFPGPSLFICVAVFAFTLVTLSGFLQVRCANAQLPCCGCNLPCAACTGIQIEEAEITRRHFSSEMEAHRNWLTDRYFTDYIRPTWMSATQQLTVTGMFQAGLIGTFFDAKHQLETQSLLDEIHIEAIEEYQPSAPLCRFASVTTALASSEQRKRANRIGFAENVLGRNMLAENTLAGRGRVIESDSRLRQFRTIYCHPEDGDGHLVGSEEMICGENPPDDPSRYNNDVNFTGLVDRPLTLDVNTVDNENTPAEKDIIALARNLYNQEIIDYQGAEGGDEPRSPLLAVTANIENFIEFNAYNAKLNVAENSFFHLVSEKSKGTGASGEYLTQLMQQLGLTQEDADRMLGENPSYFAQMEVLTKKLYQNPNFLVGLIDLPQNINRQMAALETFELMQKRDFYLGLVRQEMLLSVILEELLNERFDDIDKRNVNQNTQP